MSIQTTSSNFAPEQPVDALEARLTAIKSRYPGVDMTGVDISERLHQSAELLTQAHDQFLSPWNICLKDWVILRLVHVNSHRFTDVNNAINELSMMGFPPATVSQVIRRLAHDRYIESQPHERDRRRNNYTITPQGATLIEQVRPKLRCFHSECTANLEDDRVAHLSRHIDRLIASQLQRSKISTSGGSVSVWSTYQNDHFSDRGILVRILKIADTLVEKARRQFLDTYGMNTTEQRVLSLLFLTDAPQSPTDIMDTVLLTRGTVSGVLGRLVKQDWIKESPGNRDRRRKHYSLSTTGFSQIKTVMPALILQQTSLLNEFDREEQSNLSHLLALLTQDVLTYKGR